LTAASCSAFSAEARASAAATSMSCALAGLATGPGVGPGRAGPGRAGPGVGRAAGRPGVGVAGVAGALGASAAGAAGRRGGVGRAVVGVLGAPEAALGAAAGAGAPPPFWVSRAPRSRRATGASTVLDADLTNSPISLSLARTVLLSTPSSFASSCTRALPGTALLTLRSCEPNPQRPHSCTRSLVISGTSSCAHVGRPTLLSGWGANAPPSVAPRGRETARMCSASTPVSATPERRSARPKARRRSASAKQAGSGCRCAPRPGSRRPGSGWSRRSSPAPTATNRTSVKAGARERQPTQVRIGPAVSKSTPPPPAARIRSATGFCRIVLRDTGRLVVGLDVDPPAGEPRGQPCVLPLAADRE